MTTAATAATATYAAVSPVGVEEPPVLPDLREEPALMEANTTLPSLRAKSSELAAVFALVMSSAFSSPRVIALMLESPMVLSLPS